MFNNVPFTVWAIIVPGGLLFLLAYYAIQFLRTLNKDEDTDPDWGDDEEDDEDPPTKIVTNGQAIQAMKRLLKHPNVSSLEVSWDERGYYTVEAYEDNKGNIGGGCNDPSLNLAISDLDKMHNGISLSNNLYDDWDFLDEYSYSNDPIPGIQDEDEDEEGFDAEGWVRSKEDD